MTTEQMQELFETSDRLVSQVTLGFHRYLYNEIDWRDRLICIMGARGTGKTTLMRQRIREAFGTGSEKAVYLSLDDFWFSQYSVKDAVATFIPMDTRMSSLMRCITSAKNGSS